MASSSTDAASMRHSFITPSTTDREPARLKLARNASLPSSANPGKDVRKNGSRPETRGKRPSGLFESSESSSASDSGSDGEPTRARARKSSREHDNGERVKAMRSARGAAATMDGTTGARMGQMPRHGSAVSVERAGNGSETRKGLFEMEDDADSVETLRERVKLRQKKKESEVLRLRQDVEQAQARVVELQTALTAEQHEKDEFAIRMRECQRIIEKRNKQLIKASEKMARLTEHSERQVAELEGKVNDLTNELSATREEARLSLEQLRAKHDTKLENQRTQFEAQVERMTEVSSETRRQMTANEVALKKQIRQLEDNLNDVKARVAETDEYKDLLKRWEDAEAISRGLRFQLEKEQNEKKYLKKQVSEQAVRRASAQSVFTPASSDSLFETGNRSRVAAAQPSPASSVTSIDLSNFDFFPSVTSPPLSPSQATSAEPFQPVDHSTTDANVTPDISQKRDDEAKEDLDHDVDMKTEERDRDSLAKDSSKGEEDEDAPPAPSNDGKTRTTSTGSINFFEKLSIKFKRSTSPRTSLYVKTPEAEKQPDTPVFQQPTTSQPTSPTAATTPQGFSAGRTHVLKERPKMYVAKPPSDNEESSDSIFGSDSDSDESSSDDDSQPPPPPPPPAHQPQVQLPTVDLPSVSPPGPSIPLPTYPLFDDASDDADSSSVGDGSESDVEDKTVVDGEVPNLSFSSGVRRQAPPPTRSTTGHDVRESVSSDSDFSDQDDDKTSVPAEAPIRQCRDRHSYGGASVSEASDFDNSDKSGDVSRSMMDKDDRTRDARRSRHGSTEKPKREHRSRRHKDEETAASAKISRMNEYMEARAQKRQAKLKKRTEREDAEHKQREEYEKEWEKMAEEERERRRKQQKQRRTGRRRPSSMKTMRVSQMRQQKSKHSHQKEQQAGVPDTQPDDMETEIHRRRSRRKSDIQSSDSDSSDEEAIPVPDSQWNAAESPPLPPEPTAANNELYMRQQARLRERHEMEMKKKSEADEADQVRGEIHRKVEMWAYGKEFLHMVLTLDEITSNEALKKSQLMVVESPDSETLRKAYRTIIRVIHPDKLRGATIAEQLEAKELFTVLNQAFEKYKNQP